jgi:hypothetical protein
MQKSLILISIISLQFICCDKKKDSSDEGIIIGGVYNNYTKNVQNNFASQFTINDSTYYFQKLDASLYSHQPTSKQNVFIISLIDTIHPIYGILELRIFTDLMTPEDFFKAGTFDIDSIQINHFLYKINFTDDPWGIEAIFTWETSSYENMSFKGKGSFEIINYADGPYLSGAYYPAQKINFEFK